MLSSPVIRLGDLGARRPTSLRASICTVRERTNGAPCLGLAVAAAGVIWAGLGSTLAFLLH